MKNNCLYVRTLSIFVVIFCALVFGCKKTVHSKDAAQTSTPSGVKLLSSALESNYHPVTGEVFYNEKNSYITVAVSDDSNRYKLVDYVSEVFAAVVTTNDYCDGESLRVGYYRFVGNQPCKYQDSVLTDEKAYVVNKSGKARTFAESSKDEYEMYWNSVQDNSLKGR